MNHIGRILLLLYHLLLLYKTLFSTLYPSVLYPKTWVKKYLPQVVSGGWFPKHGLKTRPETIFPSAGPRDVGAKRVQ